MIAPWYLRFAADVFQRPAFLPVSSRAFALGAAAPLLLAAANALAQLPVAIEQPPKPELAMKMVYGGSSWRDARVAAFFGGRSPTLRAEVREVFRARYVEQDVDKLMLVYQLTPGPREQFRCPACVPALGAAVLAADAQGRWRLRAKGPLVLHGERGYSEKSGAGQASYYYSQPFYRVSGEIERDGQRFTVSGQAWLDREWSSQPLAAEQQGWDWFSLHLASGAKLMLFQVRQADGEPYRAGTWIDADGNAQALRGEQIQLSEQTWTRQPHGRKVPTRWRIQVAEHGVDVQAEAIQPRAWMDTSFPYWEGPVRLSGEPGGRGYLEMTGY